MRKITYIIVSLLILSGYTYGQSEIEANQFSRNELYGTARSISMGGAFGALGGDLTGVSINPAGIAVYRSSEVSATAVFQSEKFKAGNEKYTDNKFNFRNIGFVGYFPTRNPMIPVVNFGFSYNKIKSFDRKLGAFGTNRGSSLTDYMAHVSTQHNNGAGVDPGIMEFRDDDENYDPFLTNAPWLSVLGYNSFLINPGKDDQGNFYSSLLPQGEAVNNYLYMSESGGIDTYDFTVGTSINNVFNVGVSLTLADIYYNLYSQNSEDFAQGQNAGFDLHNWLVSEGNGVGVKLGLIYRPINTLRFGVSYHSPTWYNMTDRYSAEIFDDVAEYVTVDDYEPGSTFSGEKRNDYDFRTPDKWTFSGAAVLANKMILSVDYELTNYGSMKFSEPSNSGYLGNHFQAPNSFISSDFKASSTVRAGLEYRFTRQLSGRLGYAWMQNPYESAFVNDGNAMPAGATTAFRMEGDTNYFTGGIGYRFNRNFYADLAIVYKTQEDELYSYPNVYDDAGGSFIDAAPYSLDNSSIRGLLTIGYKF